MIKIDLDNCLNEFVKQLPKGAFLTVKGVEKVNTMTIGWGLAGIMWSKPMLMVAVRYSRFTYELIEKTNEFTVSVPKFNTMQEELMFCGTKSGRDYDKFKECNLTLANVDESTVPIIEECDLHFACKKVYQQSMEPSLIKSNTVANKYKNNDFHVMYYGEILQIYKK